ncbi:6-bladed beta-propeller [Bacteroides helcogenes]|nr:6-bladed beta-propeller [Bacteroides helcogenes]MDY5239585.1 6-bladed beta-propeller [Bacteroides helcogenes]
MSTLFIVGACTQHPNHVENDYMTVQLPLANKENKLNLSEVADSINYVILETNADCLIGTVDKILVTDNGNFLIVDKEISSSVYLYDKDGRFLRKIGEAGMGKGEYTVIEDVVCYHNWIYIWDSSAKKVLKFAENGAFLDSCPFEYSAYSICCLGEDKLAFCCDYTPNRSLYSNHQYPSLIFLDMKKNKVKSALFFDSDISCRAYLSTLNNLCNNHLYLPLNDTIYNITSSGIGKKMVLQYAEHYVKNRNAYIDRSKSERLSADDASKSFVEDMFPHLITYFACDEVNVLFMRMNKFLYYGFYYPKSGVYKECSSKNGFPIVNDIDSIAVFSPRYSKGNIIYGTAEPSQLIERKSSNPSLSQSIKELAEDSNPVVVKIFMKE